MAHRCMNRRAVLGAVPAILLLALARRGIADSEAEAVPPDVVKRFEYLSKHGNSSCARSFRDSIAGMEPTARLQGSCCGEMSLHRYGEQIAGLTQFSDIPEVPPDPYDVEARLARKLLAAYDMPLNTTEQQSYDEAIEKSEEKGPCCCQCWRWEVFGGLGKLLIRDRGFNGQQVAQVWDLSHGCGGDAHLH